MMWEQWPVISSQALRTCLEVTPGFRLPTHRIQIEDWLQNTEHCLPVTNSGSFGFPTFGFGFLERTFIEFHSERKSHFG